MLVQAVCKEKQFNIHVCSIYTISRPRIDLLKFIYRPV